MEFIRIITAFFLLNGVAFAQSKGTHHFYAEGLGRGGYYSLNYEKTLFQRTNFRDYVVVGYNTWYDSWIKPIRPNKPFHYFLIHHFLLSIGTENGHKNLKYEYGIGAILSYGYNTQHLNMLLVGSNKMYAFGFHGILGLRYYIPKTPLFARITFTPLYSPQVNEFYPWAGVSFGFKF